ncbi:MULTISPECIES: LacI family DNA-binding transcriptional regulator [unclassified Paracoccus (in: a-proteobacteria)]|uniref:LacI family DNA-binding transcriptional regulator n=1 Tax=unclassified Paracoccus (in: a-proteobacteria) TaxID=2688777 RepID=UPI0015FF78DE|nr:MULTISPECIES: LacI family DNA-binding transcriptional regulator [unclassified Paracoccus (in: a-proteobacteria)]MBB1492151.1 LacI family DNA-binding transcriptional regulator [Paracoccus sp. MC1854]MBB1498570.1 LacI family DNA-binding transcriptional regulator [Paracoccus sp. MC1862]QQO44175.1 LacI family DNA-binding transcriptional regulator [Paracoccus sp. MC1862]
MADDNETTARRPTIYDIARIAGTSASAVSSVLNGTWKKRRISARLAERISRIAAEQGYAVNLQASLLRRDRSRIIGMIIPKYDNRYFGAIAEQFETMARERGLFPVITCTRREPELEIEAARAMMSYQAEWLVVTGATEPDRIAELCGPTGLRAINLDLPGTRAPSVVSDNFTGALDLTRAILARLRADSGAQAPLYFVGGRAQDNNTRERLRGFMAAHDEANLRVPAGHCLMRGYSADKTLAAMNELRIPDGSGVFVNSTIALEGVVRWLHGQPAMPLLRFGCFDWDPFAAFLPQNVGMMQQDVGAMLSRVFDLIESPPEGAPRIEIPCRFRARA